MPHVYIVSNKHLRLPLNRLNRPPRLTTRRGERASAFLPSSVNREFTRLAFTTHRCTPTRKILCNLYNHERTISVLD